MPVMCGKIQKQIDEDLNRFSLDCHFIKYANAI